MLQYLNVPSKTKLHSKNFNDKAKLLNQLWDNLR